MEKKPIFKRWWFWVLAIIILFAAFGNKDQESAKETKTVEPAAASNDVKKVEQKEAKPETSEKPKNTNNEKKEKEVKDESIPGSIGMKPQEFQKAFNANAKELGLDLRINKINVEKGEAQDSFRHMFTNNLGILGTVNKNGGTIRDVMVMGSGDGTAKSGTDLIFSMGLLIMTTNPELSQEDRGSVLEELGLFDENVNILDIDQSTVRNGIKYRIQGSEVLGVMFSAGDVNDK